MRRSRGAAAADAPAYVIAARAGSSAPGTLHRTTRRFISSRRLSLPSALSACVTISESPARPPGRRGSDSRRPRAARALPAARPRFFCGRGYSRSLTAPMRASSSSPPSPYSADTPSRTSASAQTAAAAIPSAIIPFRRPPRRSPQSVPPAHPPRLARLPCTR